MNLLPGSAESYLDARFKGSELENSWPIAAVFEIEMPNHEVLPWIRNKQSERVEDSGDKRTRLTVGSWSWMDALAALIRFDAPFRVIGPVALAKATHSLGKGR